MKILKRVAALTAAFLISMSIVITPIKANAFSGSIAAGAITAGSVWGAVAGGLGIGLAVGADAIAKGLDNGTIDNRVEQWLWDKASEWEYGYTQAQVKGEIFKAELTYGDLKALAALLSEAYPDGSISVERGHIISKSNPADFPVPIPIDTEVYFTDYNQTGSTAITRCLYYSDNGTSITGFIKTYELPSETLVSTQDLLIVNSSNYTILKGLNVSLLSSGDLLLHTILENNTFDFYLNRLSLLSETTLVSYSMPTYVPGVGVGSATAADIQSLIDALQDAPYGMSDDDVAVSIPVTGEDVGDNTGSDVGDNVGADSKPGVDTSDIIENAPDVPIEGDFSSLKLPKTISTVFPFCLPFDFYNGIRLFSAQPVTPRFEIPVKIPNPSILGGGYVCDEVIVIDLGKFEKIGRLSRVLSTCVFLFFLIQLSTKIVKGAGA